MSRAKKTCTCDPKKLTSRGLCAIHGFAADPALARKKEATRKAMKMPLHKLLAEVIRLAHDGVYVLDGQENPVHSEAECEDLNVLIDLAALRLRVALPKIQRKRA